MTEVTNELKYDVCIYNSRHERWLFDVVGVYFAHCVFSLVFLIILYLLPFHFNHVQVLILVLTAYWQLTQE